MTILRKKRKFDDQDDVKADDVQNKGQSKDEPQNKKAKLSTDDQDEQDMMLAQQQPKLLRPLLPLANEFEEKPLVSIIENFDLFIDWMSGELKKIQVLMKILD